MKTVDESTEIVLGDVKFCKKVGLLLSAAIFPGFVILIIGSGLVGFTKGSPAAVAILVVGVMFCYVSIPIYRKIVYPIGKKHSKRFLSELSASGFNCDTVFDVGTITSYVKLSIYTGGSAVIAVDYGQRLAAIMFYNNPSEPYIIPARLITDIWSGKNDDGDTVSASFGFKVNETELIIPAATQIMRPAIIEFSTREKYETGNVGKKFIEAVEKADNFATVLKNLTGLK